jgi:anti-sigma B factor antagonist
MDLDIRQKDGICFLKIKGKLKFGTDVTAFDKAVQDALGGGATKLIFDFSEVPMIDSSGIGSVVGALRNAKEAGGDVRLVSPSSFVERTFKMVGILRLFQVFSTEEEAIASYTE